jgi:hypothetical protein
LALSACAGSAVEFTSNACAAELAATTAQETSTATGALQTGEETSAAASTQQTATAATTPASVEYDSDDLEPSVVGTDTLYIVVAGDVFTFEGEGATMDGSVVTITSAGTYRISGTLNDGQIIVDTQDEETVYLVLDGVDITCSTGAPIYVVNAANDGIKGRDSIAVLDGTITVIAGADGLQSTSDEDTEKGYIAIEGGTFDITAGLDGIQAQTSLLVSGGEITIVSGGGSVDSSSGGAWGGRGIEGNLNQTTESAKGLKASVDLTITDGVIQINSLDDALHSNDNITIDGGDILFASEDDGIHADTALTINGSDLTITQSYEGLESVIITINDGTIHLTASDDGINASSGNGGTAAGMQPVRGQGGFESGNNYLYINGGYLFVDANGDGIDAVGSIEMTAGTIIVNGPTNDGNGPLDYLGTFNVSGGYLIAVGSSGMAQAPSTTSTQYSVMYNFASTRAAGTMVHIETDSGEEILTFVPTKQYQSVLLSSPELENGLTYVLYAGGSSNGTATDGLYSSETYTGGSQLASFTIASVVAGAGSAAGGFGGGGRGRP